MRLFFALLLSLTLFSCNEKIVQLPETTNQDITEILDVSTIYMFYNEAANEAEFNRKNMISSTNWLIAIDKRITLKQALPHLQYLYEKRHDEGMHSNNKAKNFLSCSNTKIKDLAFIENTKVVYSTEPAENYNAINSDKNGEKHYFINFKSLDNVSIGTESSNEKTTLSNLKTLVSDFIKDENIQYHLHTSYNENLSFQDYITIKSLLLDFKQENVMISNEEIIYN